MRLWIAVAAVAVLAGACSGGDPAPAAGGSPSATASASATPSPAVRGEVTDDDLVGLVYWEETGFWSGFPATLGYGQIPPAVVETFLSITEEEEDERYLPYLLDLSALPTPLSSDARAVLTRWLGPTERFPVFEWFEARGFLGPEDDGETYLRFKQALITGIQADMGAFLDPEAGRLISAQEILWGGVRIDSIPPLESPAFVTPGEAAEWINAEDLVIGVEIDGDVRAYPRRIIDWHEMVNDTVGGIPVSLAYCTLCGSAVLYDGRVGDEVYRFGTSGLLYRSNKLMYDRVTGTLWEQYTGEPVWGDLVGSGVRLDILPVVHTTYGEWLAAHPDTQVLDIDTGFVRDYSPGAAYAAYFASTELIFPAPDRQGPLASKDVVYAVRVDEDVVAYPVDLLAERGLIRDAIGGRGVVVLPTADGSGGRAYEVGEVSFASYDVSARLLQSEDGRTWALTEEELVAADGERLARLPGHNSFWFAVTNQAPSWRLYEEE